MLHRLWRCLLLAAPQQSLSRCAGWFARSRNQLLKNTLIRLFVRAYRVDMSEAAEPDPLGYPDFNAFFGRSLRPGLRPVAPGEEVLVSPADGTLSAFGAVKAGAAVQAKGVPYSVAELLGNVEDALPFQDGSFLTVYLAPHNYHRVHMPLAAQLLHERFLPGRLLPVNAASAAGFPRLFTGNRRRVCLFAHKEQRFAMVLVGALVVGAIHTVWDSQTPATIPGILNKGAEMGRFLLGSTVVLLLPPAFSPDPALRPGMPLKMGQALGQVQ